MTEISFAADELSHNVVVKITRIKTFRIRLLLSLLCLRIAQKIAPYQIQILEHLGQPWLFYCQFCGRDFNDFFISGRLNFTIQCPHCMRQNLASSNSVKAWTIKSDDVEFCSYGCGFVEPYGFVPEADCPIHDR